MTDVDRFLAAAFGHLADGEAVAFRPFLGGRAYRWKRFPAGQLAQAAAFVADVAGNPQVQSVFVHVNPVKADGLRPVNRADVTRYAWLFVDVDPLRRSPAGADLAGVHATAAEKAEAAGLAELVKLRLAGFAIPAIDVDTGNGRQLWYAVDLANDPFAQDLVRAFLAALARSTVGAMYRARIDADLHPPAQLARVPGTVNRKYPPRIGRPPRRARLLECGPRQPVPAEHVGLFIATRTPPPPTNAPPPATAPAPLPADLEGYVRTALVNECAAVARTPPGRASEADGPLNKAAYALGGFVGAGRLDRALAERELAIAGRQAGLTDPQIAKAIRSGMDAGAKKPRHRT